MQYYRHTCKKRISFRKINLFDNDFKRACMRNSNETERHSRKPSKKESYQKFDEPKKEAKETVRFFTVISYYLLFRLDTDKDTTIRDTGTDNGDDVTRSTVLGVDKVGADHSGQEASNNQSTSTASVMDLLEVYKTATDVPIENFGSSESIYSGSDDSTVNASDTIDKVLFSDSVEGDDSSFTLQYGTLDNTSHNGSFLESSDDTIRANSNCDPICKNPT